MCSHHHGETLRYIVYNIANKTGAVNRASHAERMRAEVRATCAGNMDFGNGSAQQPVILCGSLGGVKGRRGRSGKLCLSGKDTGNAGFQFGAVKAAVRKGFGGSGSSLAGKAGGVGNQHEVHARVHRGQDAVYCAEEFLHGLHLHAVASDKTGESHLTAQQVGDDAA